MREMERTGSSAVAGIGCMQTVYQMLSIWKRKQPCVHIVQKIECFINIILCQMHVQLYRNLNVIDMCDVRRMYKDE